MGALTPQKQPDLFVEVVRSVRAAGHAVQALIVGDGPLAGHLAVLAADQGIQFLGPRSECSLRRSDLLVFPSLPAGEGMPGVLIEAGLSGLPAVSTPVPGAATVLEEVSPASSWRTQWPPWPQRSVNSWTIRTAGPQWGQRPAVDVSRSSRWT